jgi:hypothetical protein
MLFHFLLLRRGEFAGSWPVKSTALHIHPVRTRRLSGDDMDAFFEQNKCHDLPRYRKLLEIKRLKERLRGILALNR